MAATVVENFVGGAFVSSDRLLDSLEPATGQAVARIPDSAETDVDAAVAAAVRAFPTWSALGPEKRAECLLRVADLLEQKLDEFAEAESRDQGKPLWLARAVDIPRAVKNFRHFAHTVPHLMGTSKMLHDSGTLCYTMRSPVGVAGLISPWNLPLYLLTFKMAPALVCGNTVVAKPSEMTSLTAFMLCRIFKQAGLPDGVVNVVFGLGPTVGEALVKHPDVPLVSFTGSTATGTAISTLCAPMFKKLSLEMGGKNGAILFRDCDLAAACETLVRSCFINQGQVCLCTSRIFVHKDIIDLFLERFTEKTRKLRVGDPSDPDVFLGALNSEGHLRKVRSYVALAKEEGGKVVCGDGVHALNLDHKNRNGFFMLPTIITGVKDDARCMQEEIFGPVACVTSFEEEDEVVRRANATRYGLCASVWTKDLATAHRVAHKLKVGTVWTNCWMVRDMDLPFGGVKASGMGLEGTHESFEFFTEVKSICTNISS